MGWKFAVCLVLISVVVGGCQPASRSMGGRSHTISTTTTDVPVVGRAALQRPVEVPGRAVVVVPFVLESEKGMFERDDPFQRRGSMPPASHGGPTWLENASLGARNGATYAAGQVRWHNAFIRDLDRNEEWMVLDRRGVITSLAFLSPPRTTPQEITNLLFLATTEDTNGDGYLNSLDARRLWLAEGDGRNPRPITPAGAYVLRVWIDWQYENLYAQVLFDSDGDGRFTDADEAMPWMLRLGLDDVARPVIDAELVSRARRLLE
ncbi:MAG: hypothetical protein KIT54_02360 [Phycisphaeraceae bacterium]|nr:hypothetical protein [Phycisphaeraceae bacterium]